MNDYLPWIADNELLDAVDALIKSSEKAYSHAEERIQKNVIDPFSSITIVSTLNIKSSEDLNRIQASQSALSGMSNAIGTFHQSVLGSVEGWLNHDTGYDLENPSRKLIAEIKNKHNTMNQQNREKVISDLDTALKQKGREWTGYLVQIISKNRERFTKKTGFGRELYETDGSTFYELATGYSTALYDLYHALEKLLSEINGSLSSEIKDMCRRILTNSIPK